MLKNHASSVKGCGILGSSVPPDKLVRKLLKLENRSYILSTMYEQHFFERYADGY
jgi:hypothetical protein